MDRVLSSVAILLACAALVVSLASGSPPTTTQQIPDNLAERIADIEDVLEVLNHRDMPRYPAGEGSAAGPKALGVKLPQKNTSSPTDPETKEATYVDAASWSGVARKIAVELRLDDNQIKALEQALDGCLRLKRTAAREKDEKKAALFVRLARRRAYRQVSEVLVKTQQQQFDASLQDAARTDLNEWFMYHESCCGGKKRAKAAAKGSDK